MIKECKDVLQHIIQEHFDDIPVVRSAREEKQAIMTRKFPLISLITNPGSFDNVGKLVRYKEGEGIGQRQVRGTRKVPIVVRVWGEGEEAVDDLFSRMLPLIPRRFTLDGFEGMVTLLTEEHSDHAGNLSLLYLSVIEVEFAVDIAPAPVAVPVITGIEMEIERIGF
jgi:hypothetical protein